MIRYIATPSNINTNVRENTGYLENDEFISDRLLLACDGMGYSVNFTTLKPGMKKTMHYTHHLESCYCLSGTGTITDLSTGETHSLHAGILYALNKNDKHRVETETGMTMLGIFSPALTGHETHQADGSYQAQN